MKRYLQTPADLWQDRDNRMEPSGSPRGPFRRLSDASGASTRRPAVRRLDGFLAAMCSLRRWVTGRGARLPFLRVPDWLAIAWIPRGWVPRVGEPMVVLADPQKEKRS
jgi:hypothetical protein